MSHTITFSDCLQYKKSILQHRVSDIKRFHSGVAIVQEHMKDLPGLYTITPRGTHIATRQCYYEVVKYAKDGQIDTTYFINLSKELACTCPDVTNNGILTCKHAYACILWQMATDMYNEVLRSL